MAEWPDDNVPVATQVVAATTLRDDEPMLRLLLFDAASDVRRVDLPVSTCWELLPTLADFLKMACRP